MPPNFAGEWEAVMDMWGAKMLQAVTGVAALAAEGFGLPADAFTKRMQVWLWGVNMPVLASASINPPPPPSKNSTAHSPQPTTHK